MPAAHTCSSTSGAGLALIANSASPGNPSRNRRAAAEFLRKYAIDRLARFHRGDGLLDRGKAGDRVDARGCVHANNPYLWRDCLRAKGAGGRQKRLPTALRQFGEGLDVDFQFLEATEKRHRAPLQQRVGRAITHSDSAQKTKESPAAPQSAPAEHADADIPFSAAERDVGRVLVMSKRCGWGTRPDRDWHHAAT